MALLLLSQCPQRFRLGDGSSVEAAKPDDPLPHLAVTQTFGCTITGPHQGYFRFVAWADYLHPLKEGNRDSGLGVREEAAFQHIGCLRARSPEAAHCWAVVLAMREKRSRALKDCDSWLEQMKKELLKLNAK